MERHVSDARTACDDSRESSGARQSWRRTAGIRTRRQALSLAAIRGADISSQTTAIPISAQELPTAAQIAAKDWSACQGKILRLNVDGSIPNDNPLVNGVRSHIYTFGHRNPQGLVFSSNGILYEAEHGPSSDDELNLIEDEKNCGWPYMAGFNDDLGYFYANWSASSPTPCRELRFSTINPPPSVPRQKESAWHDPRFSPPLATLFTVPANYDFAKLGTATVGSWRYRPLHLIEQSPDGAAPFSSRQCALERCIAWCSARTDGASRVNQSSTFKSTNRYRRDLAISPDGTRIFVSTDDHGVTQTAEGTSSNRLANPGAILEFTYR
ncbi:MAG: PQQ-dependent sugar dehydrogenase [Vicinamibacterales bacterium]